MSRSSLALIGATLLLAGWMLASTLSPPVARSQPGPVRGARPAPPSVPVLDVGAVRWPPPRRLPPPRPARNPFAFSRAPAPAAAEPAGGPDLPAVVPAGEPATPVAAARRDIYLAGIAGSTVGGVRVLTAVLSDGRDLWLLVAGEALPDGRIVTRVDEDAVVLTDARGVAHVLRLR